MNTIWMLLIIPAIATLICLLFARKKIVWWEIPLIWATCIIAILICNFTIKHNLSHDDEFIGFNGVSAYYDEPYSLNEICSSTYSCGPKGESICVRYYPCVNHYGNNSFLIDQMGNIRQIGNDWFKEITTRWGNKTFVDLKREQTQNVHDDGDRWTTKWPETWQTSVPIALTQTYENRVNNSSSITFRPVTKEDAKKSKLFDYPGIGGRYNLKTVLDNSGKYWKMADTYFQYLNGIVGPAKRGHVWVLIFRNPDRSIALWQKDYWKNGNKNELILCIGVDKEGTVLWGEVFGWTEVDALKIDIRDFIEQGMVKLDDASLLSLGEYCKSEMMKRFVKPDFRKFAHLSIEPSMTIKIITAIIITLICGGACLFVVLNEFNSGDTLQNKKSSMREQLPQWPDPPPPPLPTSLRSTFSKSRPSVRSKYRR